MDINPKLNEIDTCLYRVAVKALITNQDNKVLIGLEENNNWGFPGGGIDHGEDEITALYRELFEELGIKKEDIEVDQNTIHLDIGHVQSGIPKLNIFYLVKLKSEQFTHDEEISKTNWINIDEIKKIKLSKSIGDIDKIVTFIRNAIPSNSN